MVGAEGIGGDMEDFAIHLPLLPLSVLTRKSPDQLMTFLVTVKTAVGLDIKSRLGVMGFSTSDTIWADVFCCCLTVQ